jgi:hypothetical protein
VFFTILQGNFFVHKKYWFVVPWCMHISSYILNRNSIKLAQLSIMENCIWLWQYNQTVHKCTKRNACPLKIYTQIIWILKVPSDVENIHLNLICRLITLSLNSNNPESNWNMKNKKNLVKFTWFCQHFNWLLKFK